MKKLFVVTLLALVFFMISCNKEEEKVYFELKTLNNYHVLFDNSFEVSSYVYDKLVKNKDDIADLISYTATKCSVSSAVFDDIESEIVLTILTDGMQEKKRYFVSQANFKSSVLYYEECIQGFEPNMIENFDVLLVGDSLFANFTNYKEVLGIENSYNVGIGGMTVQEVMISVLNRVVLPYSPKKIVIHLGVNDIYQFGLDLETSKSQFDDLINQLYYDTNAEVYIVSILQSVDGTMPADGSRNPSQRKKNVIEMNKYFKNLAQSSKKFTFIDANTVIVNSNGQSKRSLFLSDGIHLNQTGNNIWGAEILKGLNI